MQVSLKDFYCRIPSDLGLMGNLVGDALNFIRNECRISDEIELFELKVIMNELVLNG